MTCQRCGSERILKLSAKCSDMCHTAYRGDDKVGYPPSIEHVCGGDYVFPKVCLECGQTQGKFPVAIDSSIFPTADVNE